MLSFNSTLVEEPGARKLSTFLPLPAPKSIGSSIDSVAAWLPSTSGWLPATNTLTVPSSAATCDVWMC